MSRTVKDAFGQVQVDHSLRSKTQENVMRLASIKKPAFHKPARWAVSLACTVLFVLAGLGGYDIYYTEAAAVSIDINPSIELSINRFGRIVEVRAFDEESDGLIKAVSLSHLTYEEALEKLLSDPETEKYLSEGAVVSVTLETEKQDEALWLSKVEDCVNQVLSAHHSGVTAEYGCTTSSMRQEAHHQGMTMGKYSAIQEIIEEESEATLEEFRDMNIDEIKSHKNSCGHGNSSGNQQENKRKGHH